MVRRWFKFVIGLKSRGLITKWYRIECIEMAVLNGVQRSVRFAFDVERGNNDRSSRYGTLVASSEVTLDGEDEIFTSTVRRSRTFPPCAFLSWMDPLALPKARTTVESAGLLTVTGGDYITTSICVRVYV